MNRILPIYMVNCEMACALLHPLKVRVKDYLEVNIEYLNN